MNPNSFATNAWFIWMISWILAGILLKRGKTQNRPHLTTDVGYRIVNTTGFILLLTTWAKFPGTQFELWSLSLNTQWVFALLCTGALSVIWWARIYLGKQWSPGVTRKDTHILVKQGPYAIVRHPMYFGLITAALSLMMIRGTLTSVTGAILLTFGFVFKSRIEEAFLISEMGEDFYRSYRSEVGALLPNLKKMFHKYN
jgi:protein-S-isoprenylcysteine O-methyltransferase Ste14